MKIFRNKLVIIFAILALGGGYWIYKTIYMGNDVNDNIIHSSSTTITRDDNVVSIQTNGKVEFAKEQKLRFGQGGKVTAVLVKPGNKIEKGQLLAEIDKRDLSQEISQANERYRSSLEKFNDTKKKVFEIDANKLRREIESIKRKVKEEENNLRIMIKNAPIKSKERAINLADKKREYASKLKSYELAKATLDKEFAKKDELVAGRVAQNQKKIENIIINAQNDINDLKTGIKTINRLFAFDENGLSTEDRERAIYMTRDQGVLKRDTKILWEDLKQKTKDSEDFVNSISRTSKDINDARKIIESLIPAYQKFLETVDMGRKIADGAIVGRDYGLSASDVDAIKSTISSQRNVAYTKLTSLKDNKLNIISWDDASLAHKKVVNELQKKKNNLENDFSSLSKLAGEIQKEENSIGTNSGKVDPITRREIDNKRNEILDIRDNLRTKQTELKQIKSGKSDEIRNLKNDLRQQSLNLQKLKTKNEMYEIRAPFGGTVRSVKMRVGDIINSSSSNNEEGIIYIENADTINIPVSLDQVDIVKVKVGQQARIRFSAFPDKTLTGSVTEVSTTPSQSSAGSPGGGGGNNTSYTVTVTTTRGKLPIYSGMIASVEIELSKKTGALLVPMSAINYDEKTNMPYVIIIGKGGEEEKRIIEVGSPTKGKIEILSGATVGENIKTIDFSNNTFNAKDFDGSNNEGGAEMMMGESMM